MSLWQLHYTVFLLKAGDEQDKVVLQRPGCKTKDSTKHTEMDSIEVQSKKEFDINGSFKEDKGEKEATDKKKSEATKATTVPMAYMSSTNLTITPPVKLRQENTKIKWKKQKRFAACI